MDYWLIILTLITIIIVFLIYSVYIRNRQIDQKYYQASDISIYLRNIKYSLPEIRREVQQICKTQNWMAWPELDLYEDQTKEWRILPFKGFGLVSEENCNACPVLWRFIQSIPGVKVALLSKLGPGMKLTAHQGWGKHANHVIRCHYGFIVPNGCYLSVSDRADLSDEQIRSHRKDEWLCFDDSKYHYAHNPTDEDRVVLILDIERPTHIKPGRSNIQTTDELNSLLKEFQSTTILE